MSSTAVLNSGLRFVLLLIAQVLVFNQVSWGWGGRNYLFVLVYPLFVAMLPLLAPRPLVILLAFLLGLSVDLLSETLGLHAGALTFTAYCRPLLLHLLEPRDGYNIKASPSVHDLGAGWMFRYLALILLIHLLAFFVLQAFSFYFVAEIALKALVSLPASFVVTGMLILLFNPKA